MRRQRGKAEFDEGRSEDGRRDNIGRGGGQAHTEDDAGDGGEEQGREQQAVRRLDHHIAEDNADAGDGDHADDDTGAGAADDDGHGAEAGLDHGAGDGLDGEALLLIEEHDHGHRAGRPQGGVERRILRDEQAVEQDRDDEQIDPAVLHDLAALGNILGVHERDVRDLRLGHNGDGAAPVIEQRGNDRRDDDGDVLLLGERDHQERAGAHDRGQDLTAGGGNGLNAAGELGLVAAGLHQRNGERAGADDVGDGGAVDGAHQAGGDDRAERGAGLDLTGEGNGDVVDEVGAARGLKERAEHNEHEDDRGGNAHGRAEQTVQVGSEELADTLEGIAAVRDGHGQIRTGERIGDKDERENRHDIAEGAAGALEDDDDEAGAREGRHPGRLAQTLGEVMDLVLRHPDGDPCEDDEEHIKRAAGGAEGLAAGEFILENVLVKGLGKQDQREGEAQMHAALHGVVEQAEKAGVNMEGGHQEGDDGGHHNELVALTLFESSRCCQFAVKRGDVNLFDFFLIGHKRILSVKWGVLTKP